MSPQVLEYSPTFGSLRGASAPIVLVEAKREKDTSGTILVI